MGHSIGLVYLLESSVIKQFVFCNAKLDLYKIITSSQYIITTKNDQVHNQMTETQVQKQIDKQNVGRPDFQLLHSRFSWTDVIPSSFEHLTLVGWGQHESDWASTQWATVKPVLSVEIDVSSGLALAGHRDELRISQARAIVGGL
jgi:hypothetical protein